MRRPARCFHQRDGLHQEFESVGKVTPRLQRGRFWLMLIWLELKQMRRARWRMRCPQKPTAMAQSEQTSQMAHPVISAPVLEQLPHIMSGPQARVVLGR